MGYLSGLNIEQSQGKTQMMVMLPDGDSVMAYLDKYCRENPLMYVYNGGLDLFFTLK